MVSSEYRDENYEAWKCQNECVSCFGNGFRCVSGNLTIWYVMETWRIVVETRNTSSVFKSWSKCPSLCRFACFVDATIAIWSAFSPVYSYLGSDNSDLLFFFASFWDDLCSVWLWLLLVLLLLDFYSKLATWHVVFEIPLRNNQVYKFNLFIYWRKSKKVYQVRWTKNIALKTTHIYL